MTDRQAIGIRRVLRIVAIVAVVALAALGEQWYAGGGSSEGSSGDVVAPPPTGESGAAPSDAGGWTSEDDRVEALFRAERSDEVVEVAGRVDRQLSDDTEGSPHQRFILRLATGRTLLVAHNIDLADRVPLETGDAVRVRGEYEWNAEGGVLHWTHHDPRGRRPGGWIEWNGTRYR